jgi:hypothetical protein
VVIAHLSDALAKQGYETKVRHRTEDGVKGMYSWVDRTYTATLTEAAPPAPPAEPEAAPGAEKPEGPGSELVR